MSRYGAVYGGWEGDPVGFWREAARGVEWVRAPGEVFEEGVGGYGRWFGDAVGNVCWNAVDRHVIAGRGEQAAIVYDSPVTGVVRRISYRELLGEVAACGAMLRGLGVGRGDRVVLYMPMMPEAIVAMLACARIGAVHAVVFGGFAAAELAARIDDAGARVVVMASCGIEAGRVVAYKPLVDAAIGMAATRVEACVVVQRERLLAEMVAGRDLDWAAGMAGVRVRGDGRGGGALYPAYVGDDGAAEGGGAGGGRVHGGARLDDGGGVRDGAGGGVLDGERRGMGGGA